MQSSNNQQKEPNNSTPVAQAVPVEPTITTAPAMVVNAVPAEDDRIGICRRCRQQFVRRPGVNDGQAQYYRCDECEKFRLQDIIEGSCIIS